MSGKKGHRQFSELKKKLYFGMQIFQGYPHRRHHKNNNLNRVNKINKIEKIKTREFLKEIQKIKKNI
jgi:hypothetical protein